MATHLRCLCFILIFLSCNSISKKFYKIEKKGRFLRYYRVKFDKSEINRVNNKQFLEELEKFNFYSKQTVKYLVKKLDQKFNYLSTIIDRSYQHNSFFDKYFTDLLFYKLEKYKIKKILNEINIKKKIFSSHYLYEISEARNIKNMEHPILYEDYLNSDSENINSDDEDEDIDLPEARNFFKEDIILIKQNKIKLYILE